jgi:RNA polymerase sigma-70 factor (ECF subfamily)
VNIDVERFYQTYGPMVYRRCRSILGDEESAIDAMQDTFVRILRSGDRLDGRAPSSLLYTTATNVCLNVLRTRRRRAELQWQEEETAPAAPQRGPVGSGDHSGWENRVLDAHFLERLFAEEEESTRTMAFLHYRDGFTLEETARQTGLSVSGVRKRLRRLREKGLAMKEA